MNKHFHRYISQNQKLDLDSDLKIAHSLYHSYRKFNDTSFTDSPLASTLSNWKAEIVNSFCIHKEEHSSNGPIEGRNSLIKKVLRLANGYRNFPRFRNRIICSLYKYSSHSFKPE